MCNITLVSYYLDWFIYNLYRLCVKNVLSSDHLILLLMPCSRLLHFVFYYTISCYVHFLIVLIGFSKCRPPCREERYRVITFNACPDSQDQCPILICVLSTTILPSRHNLLPQLLPHTAIISTMLDICLLSRCVELLCACSWGFKLSYFML